MNLIGIFIFTLAAADNFIFDKENGILFEREEDIYVFDASAERIIPIMFPSPYLQFRTSFNADCGDVSNGLVPMKNNFFGLSKDDPAMKNIGEHCETAFRVFDDILLDLINADLLFTEAYSRTLDKMNFARRSADNQEEAKQQASKKKRTRREAKSKTEISTQPNRNGTDQPVQKK